jgi:oligopeptidase A
MHRLLRSSTTRPVANYGLLRRSLSSVKETRAAAAAAVALKPALAKQPFLNSLQGRRLTLLNQSYRSMASVAAKDVNYKQTPFLNWKLFPDFQHLVTQTSPAIAIPAFQKLIAAAQEQFISIEKTLEPTWDGTIGQCKLCLFFFY